MSTKEYPYENTFEWVGDNNNPYCPGQEICKKECDESCPLVCYQKAHTMYGQGNADETLEYLRKAIAIVHEYKYHKAWLDYGAICYRIGKGADMEAKRHFYLNQSVEGFQIAYGMSEDRRDTALLWMAKGFWKMGKYEEALKACDTYARHFGEEGIAGERAKILKLSGDTHTL